MSRGVSRDSMQFLKWSLGKNERLKLYLSEFEIKRKGLIVARV